MNIPLPPPPRNMVICGDNLKVTSGWPNNCISGICTDPPYGLEFMGKDWDRGLPGINFWKEFLRITKPGGFLLCFGGTRTFHRLTCAIEDAGWEIRDCMMWLYGSGFPKSHDISKAIDKKVGAKREVVGTKLGQPGYSLTNAKNQGTSLQWSNSKRNGKKECDVTAPATSLAQLWNGYGTALKPAWEPIIVAMKPLDGTFVNNAEKWGVAGLNIDGGRIKGQKRSPEFRNPKSKGQFKQSDNKNLINWDSSQGRWPANLILDEEAGKMLDEQSGKISYGKKKGGYKYQGKEYQVEGFVKDCKPQAPSNYADSGGASRFFYCAKTSRKERDLGMNGAEEKLLARSGGAQGAENRGEDKYLQDHIGLNRVAKVKNNHPTVKPLALMKYLCTLLKMPGQNQIILDPFLGSGTTAMACKELGINYIGIEKEKEYCEIAKRRIAAIKPCPN